MLGLTVDSVASIRGQIFDECKKTGLCEEGDEIMSRLEGKGAKPMSMHVTCELSPLQ